MAMQMHTTAQQSHAHITRVRQANPKDRTWCRPVDDKLAAEIREFRSPTDGETRMFYEIVIAPGYTPEGLEVLKGKSKTLRILEAAPRAPSGRSLRQVAGVRR
jgi:hypothetical protein